MPVYVFHEVEPEVLATIKTDGLKRSAQGSKQTNPLIAKTEHFLDGYLPTELKRHGLSREHALYAYLEHDGYITDIVDGAQVPLDTFIAKTAQTIARLEVNTSHCYISPLDLYDHVKTLISQGNMAGAEYAAKQYWAILRPLAEYVIPDSPERVEVMITEDIPPSSIKIYD